MKRTRFKLVFMLNNTTKQSEATVIEAPMVDGTTVRGVRRVTAGGSVSWWVLRMRGEVVVNHLRRCDTRSLMLTNFNNIAPRVHSFTVSEAAR